VGYEIFILCYLFYFSLLLLDIDRKKLAKIIFESREKRAFLNKTTHFAIGLEMLRRVIWFYLTGKKVVILDAPLLFETKLNKYVSKSIVVYPILFIYFF
jgi:dephospho-CoA kinase